MPEKLLRLGFTECTLVFCDWYLNNINKNHKNIQNLKSHFIKWLYTTSGYYDKTIISNYMDAQHIKSDPYTYSLYMKMVYDFIKDADYFVYGIHYDKNSSEFKQFGNSLNIKNNFYNESIVLNKLLNKKVLIISPFSNLIKQQFESGNCKKIYENFPNIEKINYYTNIYTFFNKGPHNNILETIDYLVNEIDIKINQNDYDIVLISSGAYSVLLAKQFYDKGKDVITLGGDLQKMFGILNKREKNEIEKNNIILKNKEYWITNIPDEYKPEGYMKIEDGCYW